MHILADTTLKVLAVYTPSLIGLLAVEAYFLNLFRLALKEKSMASNVILSTVLLGAGKIVGWLAIVMQTIMLVNADHILVGSWEVLLVPILWSVTNLTILLLLKIEPAKLIK